MRILVLLLALLVPLALGSAAGAADGANALGLKVHTTVKKQTKRWLILDVTLDNGSDKKIQFKNPEGEKIGGYRAKVGERETAAEAGKWKFTKAAGAKIMDLDPGTKTDIELKFKFDPDLDQGDAYDWTVTVTNLFVDDKKIDDVTIASKPAAK